MSGEVGILATLAVYEKGRIHLSVLRCLVFRELKTSSRVCSYIEVVE